MKCLGQCLAHSRCLLKVVNVLFPHPSLGSEMPKEREVPQDKRTWGPEGLLGEDSSHTLPKARRPEQPQRAPLAHSCCWIGVPAPLALNPPSVPTALRVKPKILTMLQKAPNNPAPSPFQPHPSFLLLLQPLATRLFLKVSRFVFTPGPSHLPFPQPGTPSPRSSRIGTCAHPRCHLLPRGL